MASGRFAWTLWLSWVAIAAATPPLHAQVVRGTVHDPATRQPVRGAVVWLADSAGTSLARAIADEHGQYSVMRPPHAIALHAVRIGYRPHFIPIGSADSVVDVAMESIPSVLPTVATVRDRVCPGDKGDNRARDVWDQTRAALLAAVVSREMRPPQVRLLSYAKHLEPFLHRVSELTREMRTSVVDRSYVAARPAWAFAAEGYMREARGGDRTFFAPDEETLLDSTFAASHCLHLVNGHDAHARQIGMAFEPTDDPERDTLVDIKGVLWLDRDSLSLASLEFQYTNLEPAADGSGGVLVFRTTPTGAPAVQRWHIRSTLIAIDAPETRNAIRRPLPPRARRTDARIVGYHEVGGEVAEAVWPGGQRWQSNYPRITGIVLDSAGAFVAGAHVWMVSSGDTVVTDSFGEFTLPYVFPGFYSVVASDSAWARTGLARTAVRSSLLAQGEAMDAVLYMHSRATTLAAVCGRQAYVAGSGVIIGRVYGSDGTPITEPRIDVWQGTPAEADSVTRPFASGDGGGDGRFALCGFSRDEPVRLRASKGKESAELQLDRWSDDVLSTELTLRRPSPNGPPAAGRP